MVLLGGPSDTFIEELVIDSNLVVNLAGKTSLIESCQIVSEAKFVVSADTGIIHVADALVCQEFVKRALRHLVKPTGPQIKLLKVIYLVCHALRMGGEIAHKRFIKSAW